MPLNSTGGAQSIMLVKQCTRETKKRKSTKKSKLENWNYAIRISKAHWVCWAATYRMQYIKSIHNES